MAIDGCTVYLDLTQDSWGQDLMDDEDTEQFTDIIYGIAEDWNVEVDDVVVGVDNHYLNTRLALEILEEAWDRWCDA